MAIVTVRAAAPADLDTLVVLNDVVQRLHARLEPTQFKTDIDVNEVRNFFTELLSRSDNHILIAEVLSDPIGYIWFESQHRSSTPFARARRRIYIHHIAVTESVHRRGVASTLIEAVEIEARARNVKRIALDSWTSNIVALDFFAAKDFVPYNIVLGKDLV